VEELSPSKDRSSSKTCTFLHKGSIKKKEDKTLGILLLSRIFSLIGGLPDGVLTQRFHTMVAFSNQGLV